MEKQILPNTAEAVVSQESAYEVLRNLGYTEIKNVDGNAMRGNRHNVIYKDVLKRKLNEINSFEYKSQGYSFAEKNIEQAMNDIDAPITEGLVMASQKIYDILFTGRAYTEELIDGSKKSYTLQYIDWENPYNNEFTFTPEFSVERDSYQGTSREYIIPDIVCHVNGIPFAVIECKKASIDAFRGVEQTIRNQKSDYIPQLYKFSQVVMSVNKNESYFATTATPKKFWAKWREQDTEWHEKLLAKCVVGRLVTEQDKNIVSLLEPARLLELVRFFILFDKNVKKIARYQQYFAVKEIAKTVEVSNECGARQGGTVWHTQGSGKSLTMVMLAKYIATTLSSNNPRVVVVTDRIELDKQITRTFINTRLRAMRASTGKGLISLIQNGNADIITTIVNKFDSASDSKAIDDSRDIFVMVDEGHRSQYGELYQKMKKVFPNACYLAFTGTPLLKNEKSTIIKFGHKLIHKYTINDGVADNQIVPLLYEGRIVDQSVNQRGIDNQLEIIIRNLTPEHKEQVKRKWSQFSKIASSEQRIRLIAFDINEHFTMNYKTGSRIYKAMLAANSRSEAIKYKQMFDELGDLNTRVVMSPPDMREGDENVDDDSKDQIKNFYVNMIKGYKDVLDYEESTKNEFIEGDEVDLLIVVDKLLTGFDAPRTTVLYLDKVLKEHSLLQAIARVNRLYDGKDYGFIIDYRGLISQLNTALGIYSGDGNFDKFESQDVVGAVVDIMMVISSTRQHYSELFDIFKCIKNKIELEEYEVLLSDDKLRDEFYDSFSKFNKNFGYILSSEKAYNALDDEEINKYKKAIKFYQELRITVKKRYGDSIDHLEYEQKLQKLIDNYISAEAVMQITSPIDILNVKSFEAELERMNSTRAKADMIRTQMTRSIDNKHSFNPAYYDKFSSLIKKTIEEYRSDRISDLEYLDAMKELLGKYQKGYGDEDVPRELVGNGRALAFYGVLTQKLNEELGMNLGDDQIIAITKDMEHIITKSIKVDWKSNSEVHKIIDQEIEDYFYDYEKLSGVVIPLETVDAISNDVKTIAKNY